MFSWVSPRTSPILVAHRGYSSAAPENTLAAFRMAIEAGADAIELDVRLSKDGELIVIHDSRLERTTDGRGRVALRSASELKKYSAGYWFGRRFSNERIPLLSEVFEIVNNRVGVNIEIKERPQSRPAVDIVERCISIARKRGALSQVLISSFHHPYLRRAKVLEPRIATGALSHAIRRFRKFPSSVAASCHADFFFCSKASLRKKMIRDIHDHNGKIGVYTVNSISNFKKLREMNIDLVFTDEIARIRSLST